MRRYALRDDQMGSDQGDAAGPRGPCWRHGGGQIGCSSKPFCSDFAPASLGAICPRALATGRSSDQRFNRWAKSGVFERVFRLLASDHDNEYMMIDATIVRAHQHSAGAKNHGARAIAPIPRRTDQLRFTRSSTPLAILSR